MPRVAAVGVGPWEAEKVISVTNLLIVTTDYYLFSLQSPPLLCTRVDERIDGDEHEKLTQSN